MPVGQNQSPRNGVGRQLARRSAALAAGLVKKKLLMFFAPVLLLIIVAALLVSGLVISMLGALAGEEVSQSMIYESGECVDVGHTAPRVVSPAAVTDRPAGGGGSGAPIAAGQLGMPVPKTWVENPTSVFGPRWGDFHDGVDFAQGDAWGKPIYAVADGVVDKAGPASGYGNWVILRHEIKGQIVDSLYGHIEDGHLHVKVGDQVKAGQHIADVGNAGFSTGAHLHFGVYPGGWAPGAGVDPMPWITNEFTATAENGDSNQDEDNKQDEKKDQPPTTSAGTAADGVVTAEDWEKLAGCEAGGDWSINTSNGFSGGLQFTQQTWAGHGGEEYAPTAAEATKEQQMEVANRVLESQGWGAWPACTNQFSELKALKPAPEGTFVSGDSEPSKDKDQDEAADDQPESGGNGPAPSDDGADTPAGPSTESDLPGLLPYTPEGNQLQASLNVEQQANVKSVLSAVRESGIPEDKKPRAAMLAIMLAGQQSNLISIDDDDKPNRVGIFAEAPSRDRKRSQLIDPKKVADRFFRDLMEIYQDDDRWATAKASDVLVKMYPEKQSLAVEFSKWEFSAADAVAVLWESEGAQAGVTMPEIFEDVDECSVGHAANPSSSGHVDPGAPLADGTVPEEFVKWIELGAQECDAVSAQFLAAQLEMESGFQKHEHNQDGAKGYSQFIDETWATWGYKVDENGQNTGPAGAGDRNNIADAVMAQARFNCHNAEVIQQWMDEGKVQGDLVEMTMGAYLGGLGAIQNAGGINDSVADSNGMTPKMYAQRIMGNMAKYADMDAVQKSDDGKRKPKDDGDLGNGPLGERILAAARTQEGLPYVWGGGDPSGPTKGIPHAQNPPGGVEGFDCSGLVQYAVSKATGGKITTERHSGHIPNTPGVVPVTDPQPGDLLVSEGHVAIYIGPGKVYQASDFGTFVGEGTPVAGAAYYRVQGD